MDNKHLQTVLKKLDCIGFIESVVDNLTLSELNTLLLEVFRKKSQKVTPSSLLESYNNNRFVNPSSFDPLVFMKLRKETLEMAANRNFIPIELSPLAPLGACSAIAPVDQNNIVSATRSTEVVSDPTNVLAMEASLRRKKFSNNDINLCCIHRAVRAQSFDNSNLSAHFEVFCMVSAGKDRGNFTFEKDMLIKHINFYLDLLENISKGLQLSVIIIPLPEKNDVIESFDPIINDLKKSLTSFPVTIRKSKDKFSYYKTFRFNIVLHKNNNEYLLVDGGFTDWSQHLLSNKKERLLTSGLGVEYLLKLTHN